LEQLIDKDLKMYWQSDGPQPHYITIQVFYILYK
jgi:hypothetical protein